MSAPEFIKAGLICTDFDEEETDFSKIYTKEENDGRLKATDVPFAARPAAVSRVKMEDQKKKGC